MRGVSNRLRWLRWGAPLLLGLGVSWTAVRAASVLHDTAPTSPAFRQVALHAGVHPARELARGVFPAPLVRLALGCCVARARLFDEHAARLDYGMGQHGVDAAARYYFGHPASALDAAESMVLLGFLEQPPARWLDAASVRGARERSARRLHGSPLQREAERALQIPLDRLVPAYVSPRARGAIASLPGQGEHVELWYLPAPGIEPGDVGLVAPQLADAVLEYAREVAFLYDVRAFEHLGAYNDRMIRGSTTELSAHAFGQAFDLAAFRFADGHRVAVADHRDPAVLRELAPLEAQLALFCDVLLTWKNEPTLHQDHYHCEVLAPRPGSERLLRDP